MPVTSLTGGSTLDIGCHVRKMRFALICPRTTTIHGSFSHVAQVLKNGVVAKGLSWHLFGFPCEEIGLSIPKRLRVWLTPTHRRRSSQGNQPQNEDAQLIGLPFDVQSLTGMWCVVCDHLQYSVSEPEKIDPDP
jgi:hypothetical protein